MVAGQVVVGQSPLQLVAPAPVLKIVSHFLSHPLLQQYKQPIRVNNLHNLVFKMLNVFIWFWKGLFGHSGSSSSSNSSPSWCQNSQNFKTKNSIDWNGLVDNVFHEEISNFAKDFNKQNNGKK